MATYAAAAKKNNKKQKEQAEKEKQAQKQKKLYELSESEDEEESDDDNISNTSKKRDREEETLVQRNKKAEMDKSMETDEEIAILGVKPGVAKKTAAKKPPPRYGKNRYQKHGRWLIVNPPIEDNSTQKDVIPHRTELTAIYQGFQIKPESH
jgi:hypothetical protein